MSEQEANNSVIENLLTEVGPEDFFIAKMASNGTVKHIKTNFPSTTNK